MQALLTQKPTLAHADPAYVLAPDVILLPAPDGTARLLDLGGQFHAVSATGTRMLKEILEGGTEDTVRRCADYYRVSPEQVRADLAVFTRQLEKQRLISLSSGPAPRRRRAIFASLLLGPALGLVCLLPRRCRAVVLLALARLSVRLFGWSRTVTVWKRCHRAGPPVSVAGREELARAIDEEVRRAAGGHPCKVECKERALCCWGLARRAGLPATLVVGINLFPLAGHCWCECGPWIVGDNRDRCEGYTPVVSYE
jgi:Transglutaminase-like superfamily/Coenzyme PQQ synthesis protein D (PqqD)